MTDNMIVAVIENDNCTSRVVAVTGTIVVFDYHHTPLVQSKYLSFHKIVSKIPRSNDVFAVSSRLYWDKKFKRLNSQEYSL